VTTVGIRTKDAAEGIVDRVRRGEEVGVTPRGKPVARAPADSTATASLKEWAERHGVAWQGGKPRGIPIGCGSCSRRGSASRASGSGGLQLHTRALVKLSIKKPGSGTVHALVKEASMVATSVIAYPGAPAAVARRA
jgi:antitoxin (DNA-binding transcriptional repressor) of toxin-antitoxin stability system